jgi:hypothetical protein
MWTIGDDALPDKVKASARVASRVSVTQATPADQTYACQMTAARVQPVLKVLYVAEYLSESQRKTDLESPHKAIEQAVPGRRALTRVSEGPFPVDDGNGAHFHGEIRQKLSGEKLVKSTRVDLLTSCAKVLRDAVHFGPNVIVGDGQGGAVANVIRYPLVIEADLQARNVHRAEAQQ